MNRQTSILSYWTLRYLLILCVGLLLVSSASVLWIRHQTKESRLQITHLLGLEIADRIVSGDGRIEMFPHFDKLIEDRKRFFRLTTEFCVIIIDDNHRLIYSQPPLPNGDVRQRLNENLSAVQEDSFAVATPVQYGTETIGYVVIIQSQKALTHFPNEYRLLAAIVAGVAVLGWLTIYLLSRKLSRPIREVAAAAQAVSQGNYDIRLEHPAKEREIAELTTSFVEMAGRLKQLEEWRTLLLAGVTHELKTPVASVKGLVHAVKEGIVTDKEAEEFLDIALAETERLHGMIADLLDYNQFATGCVEVRCDTLDAGKLISEVVYQWKLVQPDGHAAIECDIPGKPLFIYGDARRIQQIVVNLLNNSLQSKRTTPVHIRVAIREEGAMAEVVVADNGEGIPANEQPHIFERFYRGMNKKLRTRGLGLGLTYSRMLAEALGGGLVLKTSDVQQGSEFALRLRKADVLREQRARQPD